MKLQNIYVPCVSTYLPKHAQPFAEVSLMHQDSEVSVAERVPCQQTHGESHCSYVRVRKNSEQTQQRQTVCERA